MNGIQRNKGQRLGRKLSPSLSKLKCILIKSRWELTLCQNKLKEAIEHLVSYNRIIKTRTSVYWFSKIIIEINVDVNFL